MLISLAASFLVRTDFLFVGHQNGAPKGTSTHGGYILSCNFLKIIFDNHILKSTITQKWLSLFVFTYGLTPFYLNVAHANKFILS